MDDLGGIYTPILGNTHIHRWITIPFINLNTFKKCPLPLPYRFGPTRISSSILGCFRSRRLRSEEVPWVKERQEPPPKRWKSRPRSDGSSGKGRGGWGEGGEGRKIRIHSSKTGGFNFFRFWRDFFFPDPKNGVTVTASFFNHRFFFGTSWSKKRAHVGLMAWKGLDEDEWNWQHQVDCGCNWHHGNVAGNFPLEASLMTVRQRGKQLVLGVSSWWTFNVAAAVNSSCAAKKTKKTLIVWQNEQKAHKKMRQQTRQTRWSLEKWKARFFFFRHRVFPFRGA